MKKLFYNQILDKKGTKKILSWFLENYGPTRTSQFIEQLKSVGFHFATEAGLSLGFDDLKIPLKKSILLDTAENEVEACFQSYFQGKITAVERYQKFIDIWTTASENLKDEVIQNFQETDLFNPLYMMAFSGARGNISQVRQLVGMRGLMSDSAGGIIDFPIRSNFREGLTVTEYAISCYGARKGLIDTALRTADSGYLTRRLVDVAHGIMIGRLECGTQENFEIAPLKASGKSGSEATFISLEKRIVGRVLAETIHPSPAIGQSPNPKNSEAFLEGKGSILDSESKLLILKQKKPIASINEEISPSLAQKIIQYKKETVRVRSPLTCLHFQNLREDICQLCYGWSLAHGRLVSIGEAVGILAAQSIGEPGTQLTMRTFHTGGIFSTDIEAKIFAPHEGLVSFSTKGKGRKIRTFHGQTAFFTFEPIQLKIQFLTNNMGTKESSSRGETFSIFHLPPQSLLFVYPGQIVSKNMLCAEVSQFISAKALKSSSESTSFSGVRQGKGFAQQGETIEKSSKNSTFSPSRGKTVGLGTGARGSGDEGVKDLGAEAPFIQQSPRTRGLKAMRSASKATLVPSQNLAKAFTFEKEVQQTLESQRKSSESSDFEKDLDEEIQKPNSKKVLSEIGGQIYFHKLAERRQITEFENLSHVKGVGSLWVLAGKGVFAPGPFQSGDFISKKKRPTWDWMKAKPSTTPYVSLNSGSLGAGQGKAIPFPNRTTKREFEQFGRLGAGSLPGGLERANTRKNRFEISSLRRTPASGFEVFTAQKSKYFQIDFSKWVFTISFKNFPSLGEAPISVIGDHLDVQSQSTLREKTKEKIDPREGFDWFKKQSQNPFPKETIFGMQKNLSLRLGETPSAQNRIRQSKKFSYGVNRSAKLTEIDPFKFQGNIRKILNSSFSSENQEPEKTMFSLLPYLAFSSSRKFSNLTNEDCQVKIFSLTSTGYLKRIAENRFVVSQFEFFSQFQDHENGQKKSFRKLFWPMNPQSGKDISDMHPISSFQFEHGELRRKTYSKEESHSDEGMPELGKSSRTVHSKNSAGDPGAQEKSLNLRTTDLRLYKIGFEKNSFNNNLGKLSKKLGELVKIGENLDENKTIDKTIQIVRRNWVFRKKQTTGNLENEVFYTIRRVHPYLISNNSPLAVRHGDVVEPRQFLFELFYQQSKTGDIVQGLPKIEQLFEARRTSLHVIETVHARLKEKFHELCNEYPLYEAARLSIRFIQRVLIDEIQLVYQSQGVDISDKHLEIIIRQMTSKVIIHEKGKSPFFPDDIVDFHQIGQFELELAQAAQKSTTFSSHEGSPTRSEIVFEPIVLGLTKVAFLTQSFISAASFQETKRVLMNSALQSRVDFLYGLKENVIVGRFIRAGTGFRTSLFP